MSEFDMENKTVKVTLITGVCGTTGSAILDYLSLNDTEIIQGSRVIIGVDNFFRGVYDNIKDHIGSSYFLFKKGRFQDLICCKNSKGQYTVRSVKTFKYNNNKGTVTYEIDEIYHMAAVVPTKYFYLNPDLTYEENCKGTIDLFDWARFNGVKRFIVGSSSEIYGHIYDEDIPAKETTMSHFDSEEDSTRWSYAEGKLLTEHYLNHFKNEMERVCHLRFANTYGPRDMDNNHVLPYLVNCVVNQVPEIHVNKKYDKMFRTFLNNKDSSRACVELMSKGRNGTAYNVGSSEEISIKDLLALIINIARREYGIEFKSEIVESIDRPGDPTRRVLDVSRLKEDTGFVPSVTLTQGISEMIKKAIEIKENDSKLSRVNTEADKEIEKIFNGRCES